MATFENMHFLHTFFLSVAMATSNDHLYLQVIAHFNLGEILFKKIRNSLMNFKCASDRNAIIVLLFRSFKGMPGDFWPWP